MAARCFAALRLDACQSTRWVRPWFFVALLLALVAMPGCGGCGSSVNKPAVPLQKKKEKPKPPFQSSGVFGSPAAPLAQVAATTTPPEPATIPLKPGHWTSLVLQDFKANDADYQGDLDVYLAGRGWDRVPLEGVGASLTSLRKVALPRGQAKKVETPLCVSGSPEEAGVVYRLKDTGSDRSVFEGRVPGIHMPSHQYHCVVLARQPARFTYLAKMRCMTPLTSLGDEGVPSLRVHLAGGSKAAGRLMLPAQMMFYTSTASMIWDDADPAWLDPRQQQALLDWLHWGGLMIVSGPESLDALRGSFLDPYLPVRADGTRELSSQDLLPLTCFAPQGMACNLTQPQTAARWSVDAPSARLVPGAGDLVAERRVGRGRVVVSAFRLGNSQLSVWDGWDGFFNACLLRRPARNYPVGAAGVSEPSWADGSPLEDAAKISSVRYFSRDFGVRFPEVVADLRGGQAIDDTDRTGTGVAAWRDNSPAAEAARGALSHAAQIEIPSRNFVLWVLAGYLAVLGPLNWIVFRLMGRVEWLWAAAPIIAVAWTLLVIRGAQLDIGFVRARTEIDVLELQGGHARGHLTRFAALYSSLTTEYEFHFDDPAAAVLPWNLPRASREPRLSTELLSCRRGEGTDTSGLSVASNSVRFVHGEQMLELKGSLKLTGDARQGWLVRNATGIDLQGAGLLWRDENDMVRAAWAGHIAAVGDSAALEWAILADPTEKPWRLQREQSPRTSSAATAGELSLRPLLDLAADGRSLARGEVRLVAFIDGELPGMTVLPAARQTRSAAVVVANLKFGFGEDPAPDVNPPQKERR